VRIVDAEHAHAARDPDRITSRNASHSLAGPPTRN
jgi:hypothetical protein